MKHCEHNPIMICELCQPNNYCKQHDLNYCHKHQHRTAMTEAAYEKYHQSLFHYGNECYQQCKNLTYNGGKIKIFEVLSIK